MQLQNSNLKFGIMSISYMKSNFREKQHINGQDPVEQEYNIWRKNFRELLSNHIFGVESFFKAAPCRLYISTITVHCMRVTPVFCSRLS